jgi:hypothetical protein
MPFSIRPYRRFPVRCAVTCNAGPFLKLPPASVALAKRMTCSHLLSQLSPYPYGRWVAFLVIMAQLERPMQASPWASFR